jgi:hypothetical protein
MPQLQGAVANLVTQNEMLKKTGSACMTSDLGLLERAKQAQEERMQQEMKAKTENVPAAVQKSVLHEDGTWDCACGAKGLTTKFCIDCGAKKPEMWKCRCGTENKGRFCTECGAARP